MPLLADSDVFQADEGFPSPFGLSPALEGAGIRDTPDHSRRTWKAYHERQALLAGRRQCARPVDVDPLLWGNLMTGKLSELIEGERNHPRSIVRGGPSDRDSENCLLPGAALNVEFVWFWTRRSIRWIFCCVFAGPVFLASSFVFGIGDTTRHDTTRQRARQEWCGGYGDAIAKPNERKLLL